MAYNFQAWKKGAIGRKIDVDRAYGDQCVDVIMDYSQYCFPGHRWPELIGYGNAKDLFRASNAKYWNKVVNNPKDSKQVPPQGAAIVYNGFKGNPYGHIAVVDSSNVRGVNVVEQNGFNPGGKTFEVFRNYSQLPIIGWLIPRIPKPAPAPAPAVKPLPTLAPKPVPVVPVVVVKPPVTPTPAPKPLAQPTTVPLTPIPATDYAKENNTLLQKILAIVQTIFNKIIGKG